MMPGAGGDVNTTLPLVLAILSIFPCCNVPLFGIGGLIFAILAKKAKDEGNLDDARKKIKLTFIVLGAGWAFWIISVILGVVSGILQS
jgi:hypothetical protein